MVALAGARQGSRLAAVLLVVVLLLFARNVQLGCRLYWGSKRRAVPTPRSTIIHRHETPAGALRRLPVESKLAGPQVPEKTLKGKLAGHRVVPEETLNSKLAGPQLPEKALKSKLAGPRMPEKTLKVAVVNSVAWHHEVVFWLVYTLRRIRNLDLAVYIFWNLYGSEDFLKKLDSPAMFQKYRLRDFKANGTSEENPDVVFLATCSDDVLARSSDLTKMLELNPNFKLVCVVHHPELILTIAKKLLPFAKAKSLTFISLAPHVASFVQSDIIPELLQHSRMFARVPSLWSAATFLYEPNSSCPQSMSEINSSPPQDYLPCFNDFVIQGMVVLFRRNYSGIFDMLNEKLSKDPASWGNFHLNVLGANMVNLTYAEPLGKSLRFFNKIWYSDFYERMHHNVALLPAFASEGYYRNISSSSVAAALIAGVPAIGTRKFLQAYSFFEEDTIYVQMDGETETDVIDRIRRLSTAEIVAKRRKLASLNTRLIARNVKLFRSLIRRRRRSQNKH